MTYAIDFSIDADDAIQEAAYVGVDPGKHGCYAVVTHSLVETVGHMPLLPCGSFDLQQICRIVRSWVTRGVLGAVIERQRPAYLPPHLRQSKSSEYGNYLVTPSFVLGEAFMCWKMACCMAGVRFCTVLPAVWKKQLGLSLPKNTPAIDRRALSKDASLDLCQSLFPAVKLLRTSRCSVLSHDAAEAVLLGYAAFEMFDVWLSDDTDLQSCKLSRRKKTRARRTARSSKISA